MTALKYSAAAFVFALLATANSGGYRYGVSDQAFYQPAVVRALAPEKMPRDAPLLDTQTHLLLADDAMAAVVRLTGTSLPVLFLAIYAATLLALFAAAVAFARAHRYGMTATTLFLLLMTFRHRIARTGANSLEGYMHPRMLAFALGVAALAALVSGRLGLAMAAVGAAGLVHPTTALWFGLVVGVGALATSPQVRRWRALLLSAGAVVALWTVTLGPLAGRLTVMDPAWLAVFAEKDYLFPTDWPLYAWAINLSYPVVIVAVHLVRRRVSVAMAGESALVAGLLALFAVFLVSVPLTWWNVALAVQLQVTRVFWVMDVVVAAYLAWWVTERLTARGARAGTATLLLLSAASAARGAYILTVAQPDRQLVRLDFAPSAWTDVLRWLRAQPGTWHVLADPAHGWQEGVSVRVGAERDTVLEAGKDTAMAMYDRDVAMRVGERMRALATFETMNTADVRVLASRYAADVLVVPAGRVFTLPELYRNAEFVVYDLR